MKKYIAAFAVLTLGITMHSSASFAAGFRLPDQDAAAMGMAGAFVGQADNPSAAWYNPAGMTQLDGTRISAGVTAIYPVMRHENTDGTTDVSERKVFLPAELFATNKMNDKMSIGLGITSPFGLSTNWSDTSETSSVATLSRVKAIDINPNVAFKLNNDVSVGFGLDYTILQATLNKLLPGNANFRLDGKGEGLGANASIMLKANEALNLGLTYRSRIKINVEGTADVGALGISNSAKTEITLPDLLELGTSYKASEKLRLNADLEYNWWSTYDRLVVQSNTIHQLGVLMGDPSAPDTATDEKDWKNTWCLRVGGQYQLSEQWKLRAGYVYDQTPVPSNRFETRVADADRQGVTIGTGYTGGNVTIDVSYMYLRFMNRTITASLAGGSTPETSLNGTYKSTANLVAMTIAYKF